MERYELMMRSAQIAWGTFIFAFGACVGSLINVLVYRMPRGLDVVVPSSRCPSCDTRLRWKDNIPVFGWIFLRGRCRYCRSRISPEYPLVEACAGLLFLGLFVLWYYLSVDATWLGLEWGGMRPEWTRMDAYDHFPRMTWPIFAVFLTLVGSLLAMTLVDAKTFTIPLALPWTATVVGLLGHTMHAGAVDLGWARWPIARYSDWQWAIPTYNNWSSVVGALGGTLGIVVSMLLVRFGLITRSFGDEYEAWEKTELAKHPELDPEKQESADADGEPDFSGAHGVLLTVLLSAAFGAVGAVVAPLLDEPGWQGLVVGLLIGPLVGAILDRLGFWPGGGGKGGGDRTAADGEAPAESDADMWIRYPLARREMVREMAFLAAPVAFTYIGWVFIGSRLEGNVPLTLQVLAGVLLGYLIGGGVVWLIRIFGTLAFGKEAMGLGDAHLMAAVGACAGWIDTTLAFFGAAFVGIYWTIMTAVRGRVDRAMPYGPYLAIATVVVIVAKPAVEWGLGRLMGGPGGAPIDLP